MKTEDWRFRPQACRLRRLGVVRGTRRRRSEQLVREVPSRIALRQLFADPHAEHAELERALKVIRAHWGVENKLHWVLDVEFGEDASRVRKANAAQNLNTLRKFAIDFLRKDRTTNHTFKKKRRIMMWDDTMLPRIIVGR